MKNSLSVQIAEELHKVVRVDCAGFLGFAPTTLAAT